MGNLFAELKRRHIYRVAAAYVVVAWIVLQAVNNLAPGLNLPNWAVTLVIVLLAVGFPVAMIFAWTHELHTPDGAAKVESGRIDFVLAGALVVVIALVSYQQLAPSRGVRAAQQASVALGGISIAVLPFLNLSRDPDQEFFSDGMTEEITSALAKVPNLRVVGRTSAFQFKGENKDLRAIGQALSATHLIEGSVRKEGNEVRITAQLIKADDGTHLWTESYNRELKGVFAIQEEIAKAIAAALQAPLGLKQGETLVTNRANDLEAYQDYLRGRALYHSRSLDEAITVLESVVQHDPNFAPAWGILSSAYTLIPFYNPMLRSDPPDRARAAIQNTLDKAEKAAREAIRLDPKSATGYNGLAQVRYLRFNWIEGEGLYAKALELDANDPDVLHHYSIFLADSGHTAQALAVRDRLRALEPYVPIYNVVRATVVEDAGKTEDALAILEPIPPEETGGVFRNFELARAYAEHGDFAKSADTLLLITGNAFTRRSVEDAARLIRMPVQSRNPKTLPVLEGELNFVYTHIGAPERILDFADRQLAIGIGSVLRDTIWIPAAAPARKTQRFKDLARKMGLVDYWRAKGWPDLCHPTTADDFVCD